MPYDVVGQEIKVGDYIAYSEICAGSLWIDICKVTDIFKKRYSWNFQEYYVLEVSIISSETDITTTRNITVLDRVVKLGPEAIELVKTRKKKCQMTF